MRHPRALARAEGVDEVLVAEWAISQPGLADRSAAAKGWRWVAEMEEIAVTMGAAGQPGGFTWRRWRSAAVTPGTAWWQDEGRG